MTIGEKISKLRIERNLTQKQLSSLCGFSQSALNLWENGKRKPKVEQLCKMANALDIHLEDILKEDNGTGLDFSEFDYNDALEALSEIVPGFKETLESERNELKERLLIGYELLNDKGKNRAVEHVELLAKVSEFQRKPDEPDEE